MKTAHSMHESIEIQETSSNQESNVIDLSSIKLIRKDDQKNSNFGLIF